MASDSDDDVPTLSAETLAALKEVYMEDQARQALLAKMVDDKEALNKAILEEEDWQLSQFWYDDATIQSLVKVIDKTVQDDGKVALISCPTLYSPLKDQLRTQSGDRATVRLLEYDNRFLQLAAMDFIHYDYNEPLKLPPEMSHSYDLVIADPPFLSEECLTKTSETIKHLAKDKIVVCTGAIMKEHVEKLLNLKVCQFKPGHRNNLANEFCSYANFDLDDVLKS
ncbi:EEF1A lysine methyltransferase 1 [Anticarsia gemmatalis]|uniref:EEF1A lysine methyltransferase 1 n=1 Tax=Anticarsia gemmatalis TaxID=129554 RepID=UPI003F75A276